MTSVGHDPPPGVKLSELKTLSGLGPSPDVLELARWVGREWVSPLAKVLRTASPPRNVHRLPAAAVVKVDGSATTPEWVDEAFTGAGSVVRIPPAGDRWPLISHALTFGNPLFIAPTWTTVDHLVRRLQRQSISVARMPDHWARAAAGAVTVGTRPAILASLHQPGAIVVLDEHDEALAEERTPNWHVRDLAVERARRLGIPCVLVSPTPSVEALTMLSLVTLDRATEHAGWAAVHVVDRRDQPPGRSTLFSDVLVNEARSGRRVAAVLNRKGRAQMLACNSCGDLAVCEACDALVRQNDRLLVCSQCDEERPVICTSCGTTKMKNIRMGVTRAREELEALANQPVMERTGSGVVGNPDATVAVGTEALLHTADRWDTVVFLDFDQELHALRQRAASQALALVALASRRVGNRSGGGRVVIQTRDPQHPVLTAALRADPSHLTDLEATKAKALGWAPYGAQAVVSGAAAEEFVEGLDQRLGVDLRGPMDGRWLVRAANRTELASALAEVERPAGRLRILIDPPRL